jgi:hypothetical protein
MCKVLICGADPALLLARARVLEMRSFATVRVLGLEEFSHSLEGEALSLVVICNSFDSYRRQLAATIAAVLVPEVAVLTLMRANESDDDFEGETLAMSGGPRGLIEAAQRLTGHRMTW